MIKTNNSPNFKIALHVDMRQVEEAAGKRVSVSLKNIVLPKLREIAKDYDVYIKGTRYPNNYFVDETGVRVIVKKSNNGKNFLQRLFNLGIVEHIPNEGKCDYAQLVIDKVKRMIEEIK